MSKPHIIKVKCIEYWEPDSVKDHTPIPGYMVCPDRDINNCQYFGLGETLTEAWEDYLEWKDL